MLNADEQSGIEEVDAAYLAYKLAKARNSEDPEVERLHQKWDDLQRNHREANAPMGRLEARRKSRLQALSHLSEEQKHEIRRLYETTTLDTKQIAAQFSIDEPSVAYLAIELGATSRPIPEVAHVDNSGSRPAAPSGARRVNVNFSERSYHILEQLARATGKSMSDVLRESIALKAWFEQTRAEGGHVLVERADGKVREVISV